MSGPNKHLGAWRTPLPARISSSQSQPDQQPPRHYNNPGYLANGAPGGPPQTVPAPGATPLLPNQGRIIDTGAIRILCVADVRGKLDLCPYSSDATRHN